MDQIAGLYGGGGAYPQSTDPAAQAGSQIVNRRHKEWLEYHVTWTWLMDSYEMGNRYRNAVYGIDDRGFPIMNLVRHKYEYPPPSQSCATIGQRTPQGLGGAPDPTSATSSNFNLRKARTPIPSNFRDAIHKHLSKIFAKEITRTGPDALKRFWKDVDGQGTTIDEYMEQAVAPLLMTLGMLDFLYDRPVNPTGEPVANLQQEENLGLNTCVVSHILPDNVVWWKHDGRGNYVELLTREYHDNAGGWPIECFRHWTAVDSQLYTWQGQIAGPRIPHNFGRPPVHREFDRKKPRCRHVGQPRYEDVADKMREIYNRESELILADTLQAHSIIQGPPSAKKDGEATVTLDPSWMLTMARDATADGKVTYQGYEVLEFPTEGAESLRKNVQTIKDEIDRATCQTKPAGTSGTTGNSVAQSGVSKALDHRDGNLLLGEIAGTLQKVEYGLAMGVLSRLAGKPLDQSALDGVTIVYPLAFDLLNLEEITKGSTEFQAFMAAAGESPEAEIELAKKMVQELLPGLDATTYKAIFDQIKEQIEAKGKEIKDRREGMKNPRVLANQAFAQAQANGAPAPGAPGNPPAPAVPAPAPAQGNRPPVPQR